MVFYAERYYVKYNYSTCYFTMKINNSMSLLGQKSFQFLVSARVASDPRVGIFNLLFLGYETMSNCSQNLLDRLELERLFHMGVYIWEIWSGSNNRVYRLPTFWKPPHDQKPEMFLPYLL